jgi:hypothetical protein
MHNINRYIAMTSGTIELETYRVDAFPSSRIKEEHVASLVL